MSLIFSSPDLPASSLSLQIKNQQRKIKSLEAFISENGLTAPEDTQGDDDDFEEKATPQRRGSMNQQEGLEAAKAQAELQIKIDELEQKLVAESEEKEFMKSLMDDLLEQLAQKENEKKVLQDEQDSATQEAMEIRSKESDASAENSVLLQKLAEVSGGVRAP